MSKKFNIREWVLSVKYWSLLFIPHVSVCLIFLIYALVGASIIQEIESDDPRTTTSSVIIDTTTPTVPLKSFDRERERLLTKIIEKKQTVDQQQYIKFVNKHIREYEEELKKTYTSTLPTPIITQKPSSNEENSRWTFAGSLFFIGTTLTTIGSNDFIPVTKIGKLFLMIYAAIGIPLTLVFLSDLSLLITRLIKYLSLLLLRMYSSRYFLHIRQWMLFHFIEKHLNISIPTVTDEEDIFSPKFNESFRSSFDYYLNEHDTQINHPSLKQRRLSRHIHIRNIRKIYNILVETLKDIDDDIELTMPQLIITLFIYLLIGACLITSNSYFDSIYICFTSLFTINLSNYYRKTTSNHETSIRSMFTLAIYLLFGLAIVSLCIKAVQIRIQTILGDIGQKLLRDLVEFLRQMGFHELSTDDILATTDLNSYPIVGPNSDNVPFRHPRLARTSSNTSDLLSPMSVPRPIGIAEPVRRLSTGLLIRALKRAADDTSNDKSVQVNTIIRSCGRCAGSSPSPANSMLSVRKHSAVSATASSSGDVSSGCEDEDSNTNSNTMLTLPPPNLDRLRQRRATLVAKTIINQMATQPLPSLVDEPMPSLTLLTAQRHRTTDTSLPVPPKYPTKKAASPPPETPRKRGVSQEEFLEISKQISALLTPSDDES